MTAAGGAPPATRRLRPLERLLALLEDLVECTHQRVDRTGERPRCDDCGARYEAPPANRPGGGGWVHVGFVAEIAIVAVQEHPTHPNLGALAEAKRMAMFGERGRP